MVVPDYQYERVVSHTHTNGRFANHSTEKKCGIKPVRAETKLESAKLIGGGVWENKQKTLDMGFRFIPSKMSRIFWANRARRGRKVRKKKALALRNEVAFWVAKKKKKEFVQSFLLLVKKDFYWPHGFFFFFFSQKSFESVLHTVVGGFAIRKRRCKSLRCSPEPIGSCVFNPRLFS